MIELPDFDTGQYEDSELLMSNGEAMLTIKIAEQDNFIINFKKVRWHQFTALPNCTTAQIESSYFRLANLGHTEEVKEFEAIELSSQIAYVQLNHFRIFLDETGCHEFFAESASVASKEQNDF